VLDLDLDHMLIAIHAMCTIDGWVVDLTTYFINMARANCIPAGWARTEIDSLYCMVMAACNYLIHLGIINFNRWSVEYLVD
jgi:hypothetical protein